MLLTNRPEREALVILMEECAEVQQAAAKVLRFGWNSSFNNGGDSRTNDLKLTTEMGDLLAAFEVVKLNCCLANEDLAIAGNEKLARIGKYIYDAVVPYRLTAAT